MSTIIEPTTIGIPSVSEEEGARREILLKAAEVIEERGWTTGNKGMCVSGPVCVLGAISHVMGLKTTKAVLFDDVGPELIYEYEHEAGAVLRVDDPCDAFYWNDSLDCRDGGTRVPRALRRLANGESWEQATSR